MLSLTTIAAGDCHKQHRDVIGSVKALLSACQKVVLRTFDMAPRGLTFHGCVTLAAYISHALFAADEHGSSLFGDND